MLSAFAFYILQRAIINQGLLSPKLLETMQKQGMKGTLSVLLYVACIPLAYVHVAISISILAGTVIWWMIPNTEIEKELTRE